MSLKSPLSFGMMCLPVKNGGPTDFDYEKLFPMVNEFITAGYTYFDTSYVHIGANTVRKLNRPTAFTFKNLHCFHCRIPPFSSRNTGKPFR